MALGTLPQKNNLLLLASLFVWELSIAGITMAMYMKGDRPFAGFLTSNPGMVFLLAIAAFLIAGSVLIHQYLASKRSSSRHFRLIVMMNLVTVILILVTGEFAVRAGSRSSQEGEKIGRVELMPKNWETIALHYRQLLDQVGGDLSYLVYDDLMGWTVGSNRRSADGLYLSSSEGIRAPHEKVTFSKIAGKTRIALVGDSFTFGEDVRYEETWGYFLEQALGSEFQVLNFGVPGYGVDQAYLRHEKDARIWNPNIVIFGLISHDVVRTMYVYPFLALPEWNMPFSKSRFILRDGEITNVNVPPLDPEAIFSRGSISELPLLEYQKGYRQSEWQKSLYHLSYLARLFVSWFPRWSSITPDASDEALASVNASILKTFTRSAAQAGAIPLVVYFPSRAELEKPSSSLSPGKRVLQQADIAYIDLTSCLLKLNSADWFVPLKRHYSPQANARVASCLHKAVNEALTQTL
jgi:hypothetical protein